MEWSLVVFLGMGIVSTLLLIGIIIIGTRQSSEFKELEATIGKRSRKINSDNRELWKALKQSEEEKKMLLKRLENLETIVTSETWESVRAGEDKETIQLTLEEKESVELNDADKAEKIAKWVR